MDISNINNCTKCLNVVSWRHHALECDGCGKWQHLKCDTGVSREEYRQAVIDGTDLAWMCMICKVC